MTNGNQELAYIFAGITVILFIILLIWLLVRRRLTFQETRRKTYDTYASGGMKIRAAKGSVVPKSDETYNAIQITRKLIQKYSSQGFDTSRSDKALKSAIELYRSNQFDAALEEINRAKKYLLESQVVGPEAQVVGRETQVVGREAQVSGRTEEEVESMEAQLKKKLPENYMQAKFQITLSEDLITEYESQGKNVDNSRKILEKAKKLFDEKNYTESLKFALKAKRALEEPTEEKVEVPEVRDTSAKVTTATEVTEETYKGQKIQVTVEKGVRVCYQCGASAKEKDMYCRKCGSKIEVFNYCPRCGEKVEPDDRFCGMCGTGLIE